ncbi:N-acetylmuramoyl-L-alanine amidase [Clostridium ganghwense]|uniref:N-acetylmuramoyl-L-alanine amidase n=1 Tax=Clostridium ganghwense TaxID=312089 RepID=A0ABT4CVW6_9CLOT|nr:N-acetylmuramoyl-L-alanine amidase [Clostridium ganghwense]MCY6372583.1 N-acetylmuramoyl-L-alanine amidase [Clostridium ganghwense]
MKIFIDPGHGGMDSGAVGNGLLEKDIALDISLKQKILFEKLGHIVKISRTTDKYVDLSVRTTEANNWGADIFISNHINAGGGVGEEVWCSIYGGKGREYATKVEKELSTLFKSRGVKTKRGSDGDYFYVIRETIMPAILNEIGFIDNTEDAAKLKKEDIRQRCAEAVVMSICGKLPEEQFKPIPLRTNYKVAAINIVSGKLNIVKTFEKDAYVTASKEDGEFYGLDINGVMGWIPKESTRLR